MGVKSLWKLIRPTADNISLEDLYFKTLAIDVNIWMYQLLRIHTANPNISEANVAIKIFFRRLCKLLYASICPVLIFEGTSTPKAKQKTLKRRALKDEAYSIKARQLLRKYVTDSLSSMNHNTAKIKFCTAAKAISKNEYASDDFFFHPYNDEKTGNNECLVKPYSSEYNTLSCVDKLKCLEFHNRHKASNIFSTNTKNSDQFSTLQIERVNYHGRLVNDINALKRELSCKKIVFSKVSSAFSIDGLGVTSGEKRDDSNINTDRVSVGAQVKYPDFESIYPLNSTVINPPSCAVGVCDNKQADTISTLKSSPLNKRVLDESFHTIDNNVDDNRGILPIAPLSSDSLYADHGSNNIPGPFFSKKTKISTFYIPGISTVPAEIGNPVNNLDDVYPINSNATFKSKDLSASLSSYTGSNNSSYASKTGIDTCADNINTNNVSSPGHCQLPICSKDTDVFLTKNVKINPGEKDPSRDLPSIKNIESNTSLLDRFYQIQQQTLKPTKYLNHLFKELGMLFGCLNIESPGEAEAQCAYLAINSLIDGIVSDDSDSIVYSEMLQSPACTWNHKNTMIIKNLFQRNNNPPECYSLERIRKVMGIDTSVYLTLLHLLGSDYNDGVVGIGPIAALEIAAMLKESNLDIYELPKIIQSLRKGSESPTHYDKFRSYLKRFTIYSDELFLDPSVEKLFRNPLINRNAIKEKPSVLKMNINIEGICSFMKEHLKWSKEKTLTYLEPVLKHRSEIQNQHLLNTLDVHFSYTHTRSTTKNENANSGKGNVPVMFSRRIEKAVNLLLKNTN